MPNPVLATEALARGVKNDFISTYKQYAADYEAQAALWMDLTKGSEGADEEYVYPESSPRARRWPRGEPRARNGFRFRNFTVTNHTWNAAVEWHSEDEEDDRTGSLVEQAVDAGQSFAELPIRILMQQLNGSTDLDLLPALVNAPDGAALFAATDGASAARFGATGGNTLTGAGIAASDIRADFHRLVARATLFQHTTGAPLLPPSLLNEWVIAYGAANVEAFNEAFLQAITTDRAREGGFSNVVISAGYKITLQASPYITTNNWFARPVKVPHKSLFRQTRRGLRDNVDDWSNSDRTRDTQIKAVMFDARFGWGRALPYDLLRVTNS